MNPTPLELQRVYTQGRLLSQIEQTIRDTLLSIIQTKVVQQKQKEEVRPKVQAIRAKLSEYLKTHSKLNEDLDEKTLYVLMNDLQLAFKGRQDYKAYLQSIQLIPRESPHLREIDSWEQYEPLQSSKRSIQALYLRHREPDQRYYYITIIYDNKTLLTYDILINLIDVGKELSQLPRISVDNTHVILRKINEWVRTLYFSQTTLKDMIDLKGIIKYIQLTMFNLLTHENKCRRCKEFLKRDADDGFIMPYIMYVDGQFYHEECFFFQDQI